MRSTVLASVWLGLAALPSILAQQAPNTSTSPSGNNIMAPANGQLLTAGSAFTITWTPTKTGDTDPSFEKVDLVLLSGPASSATPVLTIATGVPNQGSYIWSVPSTLKPGTSDYAVELIVEGSGAYQIGSQIGVQNLGYVAPSGSSSSSSFAWSTSASSSTSGSASGSSTSTSVTGTGGASTTASGSSSTGTSVSTSETSSSTTATSASTTTPSKTSGSSAATSASATAASTGAAMTAGAEVNLVMGVVGLCAALVL